ncbi:hypothetical protein AMECASPLE_000469, partial [Ameca splendens]
MQVVSSCLHESMEPQLKHQSCLKPRFLSRKRWLAPSRLGSASNRGVKVTWCLVD